MLLLLLAVASIFLSDFGKEAKGYLLNSMKTQYFDYYSEILPQTCKSVWRLNREQYSLGYNFIGRITTPFLEELLDRENCELSKV